MTTYLVALAVEVEPGQGDPANWNWTELLDTPLPASAILSVEADDDWTVSQNILQLSSLLKNHATKEA